ncbi:hypothetical protein [Urbifossiella limnaea]|uniref:Uncharacterized protein n=1 Tax=Urbifossiella limnaea TaxID=2528023 RepID=A0A517Y3F2_9BACT|nr:hypothetical protein [Urbifossiella limnaea]QDU24315.1 hypothetical protein ETAA1_63290 [Urbifossiella limnaea]
MRRLAFVLLATLIVGVSTASPAQGYWSLFHKPHHLPHARPHHGAYYQVAPSSDPNALTAGQIFRGIQLGGQLLWPFLNPGQPQPNQPQQPAPEPRISAATSKQIVKTGEAVNKSVDNVNELLKLVRTGDPRIKDTLKDVTKTGAAKPTTTSDDDDPFKKN